MIFNESERPLSLEDFFPIQDAIPQNQKLSELSLFHELNSSHIAYQNQSLALTSSISQYYDNEEAPTGTNLAKNQEHLFRSRARISKKGQKQIDGRKDRMENRGQTKNIPKNFLKSFEIFFVTHQNMIQKIILECDLSCTYEEVRDELRAKIQDKGKVIGLMKLCERGDEKKKCIRIIWNIFLRKHSYKWIFNSKVITYFSHLKYRARILQESRKPEDFLSLKYNFK